MEKHLAQGGRVHFLNDIIHRLITWLCWTLRDSALSTERKTFATRAGAACRTFLIPLIFGLKIESRRRGLTEGRKKGLDAQVEDAKKLCKLWFDAGGGGGGEIFRRVRHARGEFIKITELPKILRSSSAPRAVAIFMQLSITLAVAPLLTSYLHLFSRPETSSPFYLVRFLPRSRTDSGDGVAILFNLFWTEGSWSLTDRELRVNAKVTRFIMTDGAKKLFICTSVKYN